MSRSCDAPDGGMGGFLKIQYLQEACRLSRKARGHGGDSRRGYNKKKRILRYSLRNRINTGTKKSLKKWSAWCLKFKKKHKVPVLCGEFGCVAHAMPKTRKNWTRDIISISGRTGYPILTGITRTWISASVDYTKKYKNNPNYALKTRTDKPILKALQSGIL